MDEATLSRSLLLDKSFSSLSNERPYTELPMLALICPRLDLYKLVILSQH